MFLHANKVYPGTWSTVNGPFGQMVESGGIVRYTYTSPGKSAQQPVPYFEGLSMAEAKDKLLQLLESTLGE